MEDAQSAAKLYTPIPVGLAQTRLLRLHHGLATSPLLADLVVIDIEPERVLLHETQQQITYTALSYTWGDGPFSHDITINGVPWRLKEGLYDFLQQYKADKSSEKNLYLWIDAIVINQEDADEKSRQVATMIDFYGKARHVQAWLGKPTRYTREAVDFLFDLSKDYKRKIEDIDNNALGGLRDLYTRAWPSRIWVRQEVFAAKSISLQCGSFIIPLDVFKSGVTSLRDAQPRCSEMSAEKIYQSHGGPWWLHDKLNISESQLAAISFLVQKVDCEQYPHERALSRLGGWSMNNNGYKDIRWLLFESVNCISTDVRDRIYALVGMCNDPTVEVDYNKTPAEVFISFAKHIIMHTGTLFHVLDLSCKYGRESDLNLPSWVPDWRTVDLFRPGVNWNGSKHDLTRSFNSSEPHVLALLGFQLGTAVLFESKKSRAAKECLVCIDWNRIRSKIRSVPGYPAVLNSIGGEQTLSLESWHGKTDPRSGDVLIAARGSDLLLVLLRPRTESGGALYEFVHCVFGYQRCECHESMLDYGFDNGLLERFDVV